MTNRDQKAADKYGVRGFNLRSDLPADDDNFYENAFFGTRKALVVPFRFLLGSPACVAYHSYRPRMGYLVGMASSVHRPLKHPLSKSATPHDWREKIITRSQAADDLPTLERTPGPPPLDQLGCRAAHPSKGRCDLCVEHNKECYYDYPGEFYNGIQPGPGQAPPIDPQLWRAPKGEYGVLDASYANREMFLHGLNVLPQPPPAQPLPGGSDARPSDSGYAHGPPGDTSRVEQPAMGSLRPPPTFPASSSTSQGGSARLPATTQGPLTRVPLPPRTAGQRPDPAAGQPSYVASGQHSLSWNASAHQAAPYTHAAQTAPAHLTRASLDDTRAVPPGFFPPGPQYRDGVGFPGRESYSFDGTFAPYSATNNYVPHDISARSPPASAAHAVSTPPGGSWQSGPLHSSRLDIHPAQAGAVPRHSHIPPRTASFVSVPSRHSSMILSGPGVHDYQVGSSDSAFAALDRAAGPAAAAALDTAVNESCRAGVLSELDRRAAVVARRDSQDVQAASSSSRTHRSHEHVVAPNVPLFTLTPLQGRPRGPMPPAPFAPATNLGPSGTLRQPEHVHADGVSGVDLCHTKVLHLSSIHSSLLSSAAGRRYVCC
ncbi:hypothetical protein C8T65DRAFT_741079 [Cerioporus squamosus]|nr:hypothetical protein C8T65DRAFT_741079 [Cerioporus squamosus]